MPQSKKIGGNKKSQNIKLQGLEHKIEFMLGQMVFIKTDKEQEPVMVTGIMLRPNNSVIYEVSSGKDCSDHYEIELSAEKDVLFSIT